MKNKIFKTFYSTFSFLADKTKGWKIFVNPKLFFGALIIGLTALSANSCQTPEPGMCYDPVMPEEPEDEPLCYAPVEPEVTCYWAGPPTN